MSRLSRGSVLLVLLLAGCPGQKTAPVPAAPAIPPASAHPPSLAFSSLKEARPEAVRRITVVVLPDGRVSAGEPEDCERWCDGLVPSGRKSKNAAVGTEIPAIPRPTTHCTLTTIARRTRLELRTRTWPRAWAL